jgi:protein-L-isoaspartate(D-aspartate) O-methyltransferase
LRSIQDYRDFYANFIVKSVGSSSGELIAAFASTEREHFVGKGPWSIFVGSGYIPTVSDDPRLLYQDVLVGLATDRGINNGQPTLHARCIAACAPTAGELVIHIGAGSGYYTAILAALVGGTGGVIAYEIEADLAERARENLMHLPNVKVVGASASEGALPVADVIYVNAGASHPLASWLDALNDGGRLIFPLTSNEGFGGMLLVTRRNGASYAASIVTRVAFIPCIGARDDAASEAIAAALETQSIRAVKSLHRDTKPDNTAWCVGSGWWLSTAEPV